MARITGSSSKNNYGFYIDVWDTQVSDGATNTSKVGFNLYIVNNGKRFKNDTGNPYTVTVTINGTSYGGAQNIDTTDVSSSGGAHLQFSGTSNAITHDSDGSKSVYISASVSRGSYSSLDGGYMELGGWFTLQKIERYFTKTPTLTYSSADETNMNFSWSTSETCTKVILYYKLATASSYSTLTIYNNSTGTTLGTGTISGMTAGADYNIYAKCTRKDSGLDSNSTTLTKTTYPYPYIQSVGTSAITLPTPGTNISQSIVLNNPLNRTGVTVYAKKDSTSGTQFGSVANSSSELTNLAMTMNTNTMYNSIPSATSGNVVYYCVYNDGSDNHTSATVAGTFKTSETYCGPTIASGAVPTYTNTNSTHADLVGANTIIQGQSSFSITAPTITPQGGASILFYFFRIGAGDYETSTTATKTYASTTVSENVTIYCYAQDSRGYYSETRYTTMRVLPYSPPTATIEAKRNGYTESGYVKVSATRSFLSKSTATSTDVNAWTGDNSAHKVSLSISPNDAQLASSVIGTTGVSFTNAEVSISSLNKEKGYFVDVAISDKITTTLVKTVVIDKATPILSMNARSSCVSVNAIADDNSTNKFEVHGNTYLEGNSILGNPNTGPGSTQSWNNVYLREGANLSVDEGYGKFVLGTKGAFISDDDGMMNYFKLFQITLPDVPYQDIGDNYSDYIQFDIVQKNKRLGHLKIAFTATDWEDPPPGVNGDYSIIEFTKTGNIIALASQPDYFGRCYLYIKKTSTGEEDHVDVVNLHKGIGMDAATITWLNTTEYIDEDDTFEMMDKVFAVEENAAFLGAYPIDSTYTSTDSTNPMYKFGGSWTLLYNDYDIKYVGNQVLYSGTNGSGTVAKTNLLGAYNYQLIDGLFYIPSGSSSASIPTPNGYHRAYRLFFQGYTGGGAQITMYLNNIATTSLTTWSGSSYRKISSTDFFQESDIILETTMGYSNNGINLKYEVGGTSSNWAIYDVVICGYFVSDDKIYTWKRTA